MLMILMLRRRCFTLTLMPLLQRRILMLRAMYATLCHDYHATPYDCFSLMLLRRRCRSLVMRHITARVYCASAAPFCARFIDIYTRRVVGMNTGIFRRCLRAAMFYAMRHFFFHYALLAAGCCHFADTLLLRLACRRC